MATPCVAKPSRDLPNGDMYGFFDHHQAGLTGQALAQFKEYRNFLERTLIWNDIPRLWRFYCDAFEEVGDVPNRHRAALSAMFKGCVNVKEKQTAIEIIRRGLGLQQTRPCK